MVEVNAEVNPEGQDATRRDAAEAAPASETLLQRAKRLAVTDVYELPVMPGSKKLTELRAGVNRLFPAGVTLRDLMVDAKIDPNRLDGVSTARFDGVADSILQAAELGYANGGQLTEAQMDQLIRANLPRVQDSTAQVVMGGTGRAAAKVGWGALAVGGGLVAGAAVGLGVWGKAISGGDKYFGKLGALGGLFVGAAAAVVAGTIATVLTPLGLGAGSSMLSKMKNKVMPGESGARQHGGMTQRAAAQRLRAMYKNAAALGHQRAGIDGNATEPRAQLSRAEQIEAAVETEQAAPARAGQATAATPGTTREPQEVAPRTSAGLAPNVEAAIAAFTAAQQKLAGKSGWDSLASTINGQGASQNRVNSPAQAAAPAGPAAPAGQPVNRVGHLFDVDVVGAAPAGPLAGVRRTTIGVN